MSNETISYILGVLAAAALCAFGMFSWLDRRDKGEDRGLSFWIDDPSEDEGEPLEPKLNGRRP